MLKIIIIAMNIELNMNCDIVTNLKIKFLFSLLYLLHFVFVFLWQGLLMGDCKYKEENVW